MLNCIIVDDEPLARQQLKAYVERVPFLKLVGMARNTLIAQGILKNEAVDLIFMDIQMPRQTGIEFLMAHAIFQQVIFITAYPEYAVTGFELEATDYLMKPVSFDRFLRACEKAAARINGSTNIKLRDDQLDFLYVRTNQRFEKIELSSILFVEAMLNYVVIYTRTEKFIVYSSLKAMMGNLPSERFLQVHKSFLVAKNHIDAVDNNKIFIEEYILPLSRSKRSQLLAMLKKDK